MTPNRVPVEIWESLSDDEKEKNDPNDRGIMIGGFAGVPAYYKLWTKDGKVLATFNKKGNGWERDKS